MAARRFFVAGGHQLHIGDQRVLQRRATFARTILRRGAHGFAQNALRVFCVLIQGGDDLRSRLPFHGAGCQQSKSVIIAMVAVAKFRFARQLRFRGVGHADDFEIQLAVHLRFRQRGKLRSLHADVRAAAMHLNRAMHAGVGQHREALSQVGCAKETWATKPLPKKC